MTRPFDLRLGDWRDVLQDVGQVDAVITDPPFGARTHDGHDAGAIEGFDGGNRAALGYRAWTPRNVWEFVGFWSPRTTGWIVAMTSHDLLPAWENAFAFAGRYSFAPLPFVARGSRVRLQGDGPSSWTIQIIVARPRTAAAMSWGTLPGAYILPKGKWPRDERKITGSKPLWLLSELVNDYTRPGDLVCDPFAGSGTTLLAVIAAGRRGIGAERHGLTFATARNRLDEATR